MQPYSASQPPPPIAVLPQLLSAPTAPGLSSSRHDHIIISWRPRWNQRRLPSRILIAGRFPSLLHHSELRYSRRLELHHRSDANIDHLQATTYITPPSRRIHPPEPLRRNLIWSYSRSNQRHKPRRRAPQLTLPHHHTITPRSRAPPHGNPSATMVRIGLLNPTTPRTSNRRQISPQQSLLHIGKLHDSSSHHVDLL